jgi:uncharacterized protein with HEPN domain
MDENILAEQIRSLIELTNERDHRYTERDVANKDAVKAALTAVKEASEKTETALKEYKMSANEWRDAMKDLVARMPTAVDVDRRFDAATDRIVKLENFNANLMGKMWLPVILVSATAAAVAAAVVRFVLK